MTLNSEEIAKLVKSSNETWREGISMYNKKVVLLNGPPRSGKNTFATMLQFQLVRNGKTAKIWGFSWHLKRFTHGIHLGNDGWNFHPNCFEDVKDLPQEILNGKSWRQMYIYYSEKCIKPEFGKEWFGQMFLNEIGSSEEYYIIVPDSGFYDEALPVVKQFGQENCFAFQMHREGYDFSGDSRSYIDLSDVGVPYVEVFNNRDLNYLKDRAKEYTEVILNLTHNIPTLQLVNYQGVKIELEKILLDLFANEMMDDNCLLQMIGYANSYVEKNYPGIRRRVDITMDIDNYTFNVKFVK